MRRTAPIAALLAATLGLAEVARAEDPPAEVPSAVERAFLEGRIADAGALVPSPTASRPPGRGADGIAWTERMLGWRDGTGLSWGGAASPWAPGTGPSGIGFTPLEPTAARYPVVATLLREREQRETAGMRGLPESGPLAALPDPEGRIRWALDQQRAIYRPVRAEDSPDPQIAAEGRRRLERSQDLMHRAGLWAGIAIAGLVALAAFAAWLLRRSPEAG